MPLIPVLDEGGNLDRAVTPNFRILRHFRGEGNRRFRRFRGLRIPDRRIDSYFSSDHGEVKDEG